MKKDLQRSAGIIILIITVFFGNNAFSQCNSVRPAGTGTSPDCVLFLGNWSNTGNITSSDNVRATTSTFALVSECMDAKTFGFQIPSTATINGVLVKVERRAGSSNSIFDSKIQLLSGTTIGTNLAATLTAWPTTEAVASYGGITNLWGATLTPTIVNNANFGVQIQTTRIGSGAAEVDYVEMTVYYTMPTPTITSTTPVCASSIDNTASIPAVSGAGYTWSTTSGSITAGGTTNSMTYTAGAGASLTLSVTVNPSGSTCTSPSATKVITLSALPTIQTITGSATCASVGTGTISLNTSQSGVNYQLKNSLDNNVQAFKAGTGTGLIWSAVPAGNGYYVVATGAATPFCSTQTGTANITTVANPVIYTLTGSSICASAPNTGTMSLNNSDADVSYQLKDAGNSDVQTPQGGTGSSLSWSDFPAGNGYYVVATGAGPTDCTSQTGTADISVLPALSATAVKTNLSACVTNDGSITVTPGGGSGSCTYSWTGATGSGNPAPMNFTAGNVNPLTGLTYGYYNVTVTDNGGCGSISIPNIHVGFAWAVYITNSGSSSSNCGNTGSIILYGNAGNLPYTYACSDVGGGPAGTYQTGNSFTGLAAGLYDVYIKDLGGCVSTKQVTVASIAPVTVNPFARAASSCANDGSIEIYRTGGAPVYTYAISDVGGTSPGTYQASYKFTGLAAGIYRTFVKDGFGCEYFSDVTVLAGAGLTVTTGKTNVSSCINDGTIQVTASGGVPGYTYSKDDGLNYQASSSFTGLGVGSYAIKVKDSKGCTGGPNNVTLVTNPITVTNNAFDATSCSANNGKIYLFRGGGGTPPFMYSINGNDYQPGAIFLNLAPGTYSGFVRDANFCIAQVAGGQVEVGPPGCAGKITNSIAKESSSRIAKERSSKLSAPQFKVEAYPNPSSSQFMISVKGNDNEKVSLMVTDITGRKVYEATGKAQHLYMVGSNLKTGVYFLQVLQADKKQTIKLVKE